MTSFSTKTQIKNQPQNKPSIPTVASKILPRPQIPPNAPTESFDELEEQFANYFFKIVILNPFSFRQLD